MRFWQVAPGLWSAARAGINVHAITTGSATILVDTGRPQDAGPILQALQALPPVRQIVLTHGHYDHAGGAAAIASATGAPVWIGAAEVDDLRTGRWRRPSRASRDLHGRLLTALVANRYPDVIVPVPDAFALAPQDDRLPFDTQVDIRVLQTPGHAPGQIALALMLPGGQRALILADVAMNLAGLREPILYEDPTLGLQSLRQMAAEPCGLALFGHGRPLANPTAALLALAQRAQARP